MTLFSCFANSDLHERTESTQVPFHHQVIFTRWKVSSFGEADTLGCSKLNGTPICLHCVGTVTRTGVSMSPLLKTPGSDKLVGTRLCSESKVYVTRNTSSCRL
jgi:hypothetical protein